MTTNDNLKELKRFEPSQYKGINNDYLLSYVIELLTHKSIPTTFENITVAGFKLFPNNFSLVGYKDYPDAARVNRTLLHCRPKYQNLVVGSVKEGFSLTRKGEYVANQVTEKLKSDKKDLDRSVKKTAERTYTGSLPSGKNFLK